MKSQMCLSWFIPRKPKVCQAWRIWTRSVSGQKVRSYQLILTEWLPIELLLLLQACLIHKSHPQLGHRQNCPHFCIMIPYLKVLEVPTLYSDPSLWEELYLKIVSLAEGDGLPIAACLWQNCLRMKVIGRISHCVSFCLQSVAQYFFPSWNKKWERKSQIVELQN